MRPGSPLLSSRPCPCPVCARGDERPAHRALRALLDYVAPAQRPFAASQLDRRLLGERVDDALLGAIAELPAGAIAPHRVEERRFHEHQRQRLDALAADDDTRARLLHFWEQRLAHRQLDDDDPAGRHALRLRVRGRDLAVTVPACLPAYQVLFEIFLTEPYRGLPAVPEVVDLGAHLGLATLYLFAHQPATRFVCVEPLAENRALLDENLRQNGVHAEVVAAAVGPEDGEVTLHVSPRATSLCSLFPLRDLEGAPDLQLAGEARVVPARRLDSLGLTPGGGIKLDVEGAEHILVDAVALRRTRWVVGELHVGPALVARERAFALLDGMAEEHEVALSPPGLFGHTVTYTFAAIRPLRLFENRTP